MEKKKLEVTVSLAGQTRVGVLGTGNYGRAIRTKLVGSGAEVVWGSRTPGPDQVTVETVLEERILVLAVPVFSWDSLPLSNLQAGTVLIDCSNRSSWCQEGEPSQAEQLQSLLPEGVRVVKCLNTVSAYELENTSLSPGKQVPLAGDCPEAKRAVVELLDRMGFHFSDMGPLTRARDIENLPLYLFLNWRRPLAVYNFCDDNKMGWFPSDMGDLFNKYINKTCDGHAITLLAACYLPGVLAAYLQLIRGTKYFWFPAWLDNWMRMRKYLGLLMLLSASIHGCFYMLTYTPHHTSMQTNIYLGAGVIAYFTALILGLTSLPSVEANLSWSEFRMIQSRLGWVCLILATTHVMANGWHKLLKFHDCIFLGTEQIALILPLITLVLKVPLLLPCIDWRLTKIRAGREFSSICC